MISEDPLMPSRYPPIYTYQFKQSLSTEPDDRLLIEIAFNLKVH